MYTYRTFNPFILMKIKTQIYRLHTYLLKIESSIAGIENTKRCDGEGIEGFES
jgi:hypothetical protein